MKVNEEHLLRNYQKFMDSHEKMVARWLTEEWDRESSKIPSWLSSKVHRHFTMRDFGNPSAMARVICLKLLESHKHEISLPENKAT